MRAQLPTSCPSCGAELRVARLACHGCETLISGSYTLPALARLNADDQEFVASFIRSSGSLKEMAKRYGVSYPIVRNRLNELIARLAELESAVSSGEDEEET